MIRRQKKSKDATLLGYFRVINAPIAKTRYVMLSQGKDIEDWALARDKNSYSFMDGTGTYPGVILAALAEDALKDDPALLMQFKIN